MSHFGNFFFMLDWARVDEPLILLVEASHFGLKLCLVKEAVFKASLSGDFYTLRRADNGIAELLLSKS